MKPFSEPRVAKVFSAHPQDVREKLLPVRDLIFATAKQIPEVGELEETLKWGQPTYLTSGSGNGGWVGERILRGLPAVAQARWPGKR